MPREITAVQIDLGLRIRELRKEKEQSQEAVAVNARMLTPNYARIERGTLNVTLDTLVRIANALDVEVGELFRMPKREVAKAKKR